MSDPLPPGSPLPPPPPPPPGAATPSPPPPPPWPVAPRAAAPAGPRRPWLIGAGVIVLVAGLAVGVALLATRGAAEADAVERFARAPVGCTTTLEFDRTGTFVLFLETEGTVEALEGDCEVDGTYSYNGGGRPVVVLSMTGPDGERVPTDPTTGETYDTGTFVGEAIATVDITETGEYRLTVQSEEDQVAIAVGRDPSTVADERMWWAIASMAAGIVVGGAMIALGSRRRRRRPSAAPTPPPPPPGSYAPVPGWTGPDTEGTPGR